FEILEAQSKELQQMLLLVDDEKGKYSYAPGKWSIKEILGHLIDAERIFSFRALCFARGEAQPLPGFEQDDYVREANFNSRSISSFMEEVYFLRTANLILFKSFSEAELSKVGVANENPISVRAIIYIIAGHEKHHMNILKEKYLT